MAIPKRIFIEITNVCNLTCSFCLGTPRPQGFMSPALFYTIVDQAVGLVDEVVLHVLGEPLLHSEILVFIDYVLAQGLSVMLTTNGTLLNGALAEELAKRQIRQINISLHAMAAIADQDTYLDQVVAFARLAQVHNPAGYINLRFWNGDAHTERKNQLIEDRIYLHFDQQFTWPRLDLPIIQDKGFCYGLQAQFGVLVDGTVVPCCLDGAGVIALGQLPRMRLALVLQSARAQKIRQGFQKRMLVEPLCQRCSYATRFAKK